MKNLLVLFAFFVFISGTGNAQDKRNKTPRDLAGSYIGMQEWVYIHFKRNHRCEIKRRSGTTELTSIKATWLMRENGKLEFSDLDGIKLFDLEKQNGRWYEKDQREYTFKMVFVSLKDVRKKPRKGQGC